MLSSLSTTDGSLHVIACDELYHRVLDLHVGCHQSMMHGNQCTLCQHHILYGHSNSGLSDSRRCVSRALSPFLAYFGYFMSLYTSHYFISTLGVGGGGGRGGV